MTEQCPWCGRFVPDILTAGCGSREGTQEQVNRWCGFMSGLRASRGPGQKAQERAKPAKPSDTR